MGNPVLRFAVAHSARSQAINGQFGHDKGGVRTDRGRLQQSYRAQTRHNHSNGATGRR